MGNNSSSAQVEPTGSKARSQLPQNKSKQAMHKRLPDAPIVATRMKKLSTEGEKQYQDSLDSVRDKIDRIEDIRYEDYEYEFENIVFEGGGAKGRVYIGCLQVR